MLVVKERLGVLDGLRGIAILQVLLFHLWVRRGIAAPFAWLRFIPKTGSFGVELFFFLSGFVIVYPFVRAQAAGEPMPTWRHFAYRRFIKIVPSYALSIAVAYAVGFAATERSTSTVLQELVTHALFIHTWWTSTASSINGVLWTLAIEVQFYALFPLVWWLFKRWPWPTGLGLIAAAFGLRLWGRLHFAPEFLNVISGNLPNFIDYFAYGMLCAWCVVRFARHKMRPPHAYATIVAAIGIVTLLVALSQLADARTFVPRLYVKELLGPAYALIAFGAIFAPSWSSILSNPLLRFFAIISYNLYLYNWMIMNLYGPRSNVAFVIGAVSLSIVVATAITYLVERPLLRLPGPRGARG